MQNKRAVISEIDLTHVLKTISQAYEEISVLRMQRVKSSVLLTREFLDRLAEVFFDVKVSYKKEINKIKELQKRGIASVFQRKKKVDLAPLKKQKAVSILLSANTKFYGDIVQRVFELFMKSIRQDSDVVIIGRLGRDLFRQRAGGQAFTYFDLPDSNISASSVTPVLSYILSYETINVFYGRFNNVVLQVPTVTNISGEDPFKVGVEFKNKVAYFFEPSLVRVLEFFESQVFISLFKQTIFEGELSRLASRITAMEEALGNIEKREKELGGEIRRIKRLSENKRQIERLAGLLWRR